VPVLQRIGRCERLHVLVIQVPDPKSGRCWTSEGAWSATMDSAGNDGASLGDFRKLLFDRVFPAGTRIVTETHVEEKTRQVRLRIYREAAAKRVDGAPRSRQ